MTLLPTHPSLIWIVAGGFALELLIAYPDRLFKLMGHPVSWMGALITKFDQTVNSGGTRAVADFVWGLMFMGLASSVIVLSAWALSVGLTSLPFGWVLELALIASLLAARSLYDHVKAVATALADTALADTALADTVLADKGLEAGREAVSLIVGRNVDQLDEPAIARAAVESLAESSSDGIVAPLFWALIAGLPGIALYKFVNTADSLIGHRTVRHEWFGKCAARLDDLMNWIPARLTGCLFVLAAYPMGQARAALRVMVRDARLHLSPNAGWPEAAMAGALGLRLGGPRKYEDAVEAGAWLGDGCSDLTGADITRALRLYRSMLTLCGALLVGVGIAREMIV